MFFVISSPYLKSVFSQLCRMEMDGQSFYPFFSGAKLTKKHVLAKLSHTKNGVCNSF